MTYTVSGRMLNLNHSLTHSLCDEDYAKSSGQNFMKFFDRIEHVTRTTDWILCCFYSATF